jgi:hypothetical protein
MANVTGVYPQLHEPDYHTDITAWAKAWVGCQIPNYFCFHYQYLAFLTELPLLFFEPGYLLLLPVSTLPDWSYCWKSPSDGR